MVLQVLRKIDLPAHYADADHPCLRSLTWVEQQWEVARLLARQAEHGSALLVIDEVQKVR